MKRRTQQNLAKLVSRTQAHICAILQGKARASYDTAERLAAITGSTIQLWIKGTATERQQVFRQWAKQDFHRD